MTKEYKTMSSQKGFASTGDLAEKKISFTEVGPDLFAFTAEGDPNTGVIVGDDCCAVFDAQATPAMARKVIERVRAVRQADQICDSFALSRCSRAWRLCLPGTGYHRFTRDLPACRRTGAAGLGLRIRSFPALVPRRAEHPGPDMAHSRVRERNDVVPR